MSRLRWLLLIVAVLPGCWGRSGPEVVVYCALDREFSEPVLAEFTRRTGIAVQAVYDLESTKTVGLVQRIEQEGTPPRCDVFWNNEILHTLRLDQAQRLAEFRPQAAEPFPPMYRSPQGTWHGLAARARVLLVNTQRIADAADRPTSIVDLADPKWRGQAAIAKPLFGTTATHAACLFAALGEKAAQDLFRRMKQNQVQVLAGNKQVARQVAEGAVAFGLTDTDDAIIEVEAGRPVVIVYPDQHPPGVGTLFIPNTVAVLAGSPNAEPARKLIEYLLSPDVEQRLAAGPSAQIPLNPEVTTPVRVETPTTIRQMEVDFIAAAQAWAATAEFLRQEFAD